MVHARPPVCSDSAASEPTTFGGEPALTWTATCSQQDPAVHPVKFAVVHGERGYAAIFEADGTSMRAADLREFDSIRESFRFTS